MDDLDMLQPPPAQLPTLQATATAAKLKSPMLVKRECLCLTCPTPAPPPTGLLPVPVHFLPPGPDKVCRSALTVTTTAGGVGLAPAIAATGVALLLLELELSGEPWNPIGAVNLPCTYQHAVLLLLSPPLLLLVVV